MPSRFILRALSAVLFGCAPLLAQASVGHDLHIVQSFPTGISLTATPSSTASGSTVVVAALTAAGGVDAGPTGSITFTITPPGGSAAVTDTVPIENGTAIWSEAPPSGLDTIEAVYPGDANYAPARAQTTIRVIAPSAPDFDFTLPPVTIVAGQTYSGDITVTPKNGFHGTVTFAIGPLPKDVTFALPSPSTEVAADGSEAAAVPVSFAIGTKATVVTAAAGFLFLGLFGFPFRKRRKSKALAVLAILGALAVMAGCAATRFVQQNGTQPGTYSIPVTATSGNLTHTHNLTLIVQANIN